jgi:hypothetical protein
MEFVPGYRAANAPKRSQKAEARGQRSENSTTIPAGSAHRLSDEPASRSENQGPKTFDYGSGLENQLEPAGTGNPRAGDGASEGPTRESDLRLVPIVADPLSQQGANLQADAPACDVCGSITVRSGTCYKCLNCGNSMGCS